RVVDIVVARLRSKCLGCVASGDELLSQFQQNLELIVVPNLMHVETRANRGFDLLDSRSDLADVFLRGEILRLFGQVRRQEHFDTQASDRSPDQGAQHGNACEHYSAPPTIAMWQTARDASVRSRSRIEGR